MRTTGLVTAVLLAGCGAADSEICDIEGNCADLANPIAYPGPCAAARASRVDVDYTLTECSYSYEGDQGARVVYTLFQDFDGLTDGETREVAYARDAAGALQRVTFTWFAAFVDDLGTFAFAGDTVREDYLLDGEPDYAATHDAAGFAFTGHPDHCEDLVVPTAEQTITRRERFATRRR